MRRWLVGFGAFALVVGCVFTTRALRGRAPNNATVAALAASGEAPAAVKATASAVDAPPSFGGLDLVHLSIGDDGVTTTLDGKRSAKLTLDGALQRQTNAILTRHKLPEAAVVVMDPATGQILAYASHVETGPKRDLCVEAKAPSASVFKIVTASALVDKAGLGPDTRECYAGGGDQRITAGDLVVDPLRDKYCVTLGQAMGKSTNAVFARLAARDLTAAQVETAAKNFGYGEPVPFDVPVSPSKLEIPDGGLPFARTAAGFWNTTLSPLEAVWISAIVAHGGEAVRPYVVQELRDEHGLTTWTAKGPTVVRQAIGKDTAAALGAMMDHTVSEGTSYKAFHDKKGTSFLPVAASGKTGTLTDPDGQRFYTWFTGFAPAHPKPGERQVAIAVLVVNGPKWQVKANVVAREVLSAWFKNDKDPAKTVATR
jgi:cell division protein FtsI/penicillin-binding protein 2